MNLLFITQKLHGQDAFGVLWVHAFMKAGYDVTVLCLERTDTAYDFPVASMGKERGLGKFGQIRRFWKHLRVLNYDRVFLHMSPVWGFVGAPVFLWRRVPVYLWYTHYRLSLSMRVTGWYAKRFFCATPQSLPQYPSIDSGQDPSTSSGQVKAKKVVVGHGIDLEYWKKRENVTSDPRKLLVVHRLSRSKRLELILQAMTLLPDFTLDIYGIEAEPEYAAAMKDLTKNLGLEKRVTFHGTIAMDDLSDLYASHRLILNMASETIDKTMLEAMTCGCYPVVSHRNTDAIGIPAAPENDTADDIAAFVRAHADNPPLSGDEMYDVVRTRHSLDGLISKMDAYIRDGR